MGIKLFIHKFYSIDNDAVRAGCDVVHSSSQNIVDSSPCSKFSRQTVPSDPPSEKVLFFVVPACRIWPL